MYDAENLVESVTIFSGRSVFSAYRTPVQRLQADHWMQPASRGETKIKLRDELENIFGLSRITKVISKKLSSDN